MTTSPLHERPERTGRAEPRRTREPSYDERSELTADLLSRAARAQAAGDEATRTLCLERVVELNMRVAEAVARRYARRGIALEDLTQVAYLALVRAVQSFDPAHEKDLLSYAVPTMTGELRRHFRDHGWSIRPPREVQRAHGRLVRSGAPLDRVDDSSVTALAAEVEESVEVVREALVARSCFTLLSLDAPVGGEDEAGPSRDVADDDRAAEIGEARMLVHPLLATLTARERTLLRLRFTEELTQREIAERLSMSQIQVSRLLQRLLLQMRGALSEAG